MRVLLVQVAAAQNIMDAASKGVFLLECTKNHGVDFCGECNEFPCKMLMYGR